MSRRSRSREVNDVDAKGSGRQTVGGKYVFHHMIWGTRVLKAEDGAEDDPLLAALDPGTTAWPVHEVGRNADFFGLDSARLLQGGLESCLGFSASALQWTRHEGVP